MILTLPLDTLHWILWTRLQLNAVTFVAFAADASAPLHAILALSDAPVAMCTDERLISIRNRRGYQLLRGVGMGSVSHASPVEELASFLARRPSAQEILAFRLSDAALDQIHELMDKNEDGTLTPEEGRELDRLVLLDDIIGLIRARVSSHDVTDDGDTTIQSPST